MSEAALLLATLLRSVGKFGKSVGHTGRASP